MAVPTTAKFGAGVFYLGDGASPEVFTAICGFDSMDLSVDKAAGTTILPDCDDPDAPTWELKDVTSMSWSASFSGVLAKAALPLVEDAGFDPLARNIRLDIAGMGTSTEKRRYAGAAIVKFKLGAKRGERWTVSVDVEGTGALTASSVA